MFGARRKKKERRAGVPAFARERMHSMKAYHIFLLRHGMTQSNKEGRYIGRTDVPLSDEGAQGLRALAEKKPYPQADRFFASPLLRCRQSLEILYPGRPYEVVDGLAEYDFGDYEGKSMEELKDDPAYGAWIAAKGALAPPNGESTEDFQKRCGAAFEGIVESLLRDGSQRAVVLAHGGTIMFLLSSFGYPRRPFYNWLAGNGMGFEVVITPSLWMSGRVMDIAARIPEEEENDGLAGLSEAAQQLRQTETEE